MIDALVIRLVESISPSIKRTRNVSLIEELELEIRL